MREPTINDASVDARSTSARLFSDHMHTVEDECKQLLAVVNVHNITLAELQNAIELFRAGDLIQTRDRVALERALQPKTSTGGG